MGSGVNDGVILTSTLWRQSGKIYVSIDGEQTAVSGSYNQYCPIQLDTDTTHCVTGCTNTADAQILYYWLEKGYDLNLSVSTSDYYYFDEDYPQSADIGKVYVSDNPIYGEGSLTEINELLAKDTLKSSLTNGDFIAALNYYCGVKNHSEYGASTSTTYWLTTAYNGKNAASFQAAGFDSYFTIYYGNSKYFDGYILNDLGFSIVRENLDYGEVISMSIPGHAVYMDGYRYNESTGEYEYHVNYGWGIYSDSTDWYTVSELENIEIRKITIDLSPDINVNVTNTRSDYYGGSILRGVERINHIQNEKTVEFTFDESIRGESIRQDSTLYFKNGLVNIYFKDFSINFESTYSTGINSYGKMEFDIEKGSIAVNNSNAYAAIQGSRIDVNLDNSWIYTGYWSDGFDDIQNIMTNTSGYDIDDFSTSFKNSVNGHAILISSASWDDTVSLTNNSAIFGKVALSGGENTVTIETGSLIYGGFSGTNQNSLELNLIINDNPESPLLIHQTTTDDQTLYNATGGVINVDFNDTVALGTYVLVDGYSSSVMDDFSLVVNTGTETFTLNSANSEYDNYQMSVVDGNIILDVTMGNATLWTDGELVSQAAVLSDKTLNERTSMFVYKGGTAQYTEIDGNGIMHISSGGKAYRTAINASGNMHISSGGTANSTTINYRGHMHVFSGGTANNTTVNDGYMDLYSGGTANSTTINFSEMWVHTGATANRTTINSGYMDLYWRATANDTTINTNGSMYVSGTANNTTINSNGAMYVSAGGTANSTTINSYGYMKVVSGGTANSTTVYSSGYLYVSSGGTANSTTVHRSGYLIVSSGGTANNTAVNPGYLIVSSGGTANNTTLHSGLMFVRDGIANSTTINSGGIMHISSGGTANNTTHNSGGMYVFSGGVANNTTVNRYMYVSSAGTANRSIVSSGGYIYVYSKGTANSTTVYSSGYLTVVSGGTANCTTVNSKGVIHVNSKGTAVSTTLNSYGIMWLSGGTVSKTVISGGNMYAYVNGTANNTTVKSGGSMHIYHNASANNTVVSSYGHLLVYSSGKANYTSVYKDGKASVHASGSMYGVNLYSSGTLLISSGGTVDTLFYNGKAHTTVFYGGTLNNATINSNGTLAVYDGAKTTNITLKNGAVMNYYGGTCYNTILTYGGTMAVEMGAVRTSQIASTGGTIEVRNGGTASAAIAKDGGTLKVLSGGKADDTQLMTNGIMYVYSGGMVTDTVTSYGARVYVCGGTVSGTHIQRGTVVSVYQGGSAAGNRVDYGSYLIVDSGASVSDTTVSSGGGLTVMAGAAASNNEIYGTLNCNNGGILLGETTIHSRANLAGRAVVTNDTEITFDVSGRSASAMQESYREAMLNSYYVARDADMNISVAADQDFGSYILANWALEAQKDTFTLTVDGTEVGTFSTTESLTYNGKTYSLYCFDDATNSKALTLRVSNANTGIWLEIDSGDFNGDGIEEALVSNGTDLLAQADETLWLGTLSGTEEIASIADYNNDGTDDLLVHNTATDEMTAWLVKDGSTFGTLAIA